MAPPFVKRYLVALDRHKWAGLAGFAVVLGLSGVAALQPAPAVRYLSQALLTYVTPPVTLSQTGTELQQRSQALTSETLLSDYVIESVSKKLAEQQIQVDPILLRQQAKVVVNPDATEEQPGFYVLVSYEDSNDERAQLVNTLLVEAIIEQSRQFNAQQLDRILSNLNELLPKVEGELREAEQNLERYIRTEGPAIQAAEDGNLLGAITGGQEQQRQLVLSIQGIDAQMQSLQDRLGLSPDEAYASSALSADPIIADLRARIHESETQLALFAQTLRPEHPTMVDLRNQKQAYEQMLQQRVAEVIGGGQAAPLRVASAIRQASSLDPARQQLADTLVNLKTQRDTLVQQLATLRTSEQQLRQEYSGLPNKQLDLARLQQQVALKQAFYDQLQARLTDVTIAQNETVGSLVPIQSPRTGLATEETSNPILILVVGGIVGILVGGGLVLLLDSLDATFHTLPDLQNALKQQEVLVLGLLPLMPTADGDTIPVILEPDSPYMEPYERFRSNLRRAAVGGKPLKMVLLTSTVNGEGKTVASYNLAIASARAGKRTLLIEADLRSPSQAKALKVAPDPDSALEPLRYYGQLSDCIRLVPEVENLYVLPSPGAQRQASAILESSEIRRLLEDVRGRFDLVLLDTPPLSRYSDALLLEPLTDGMILVTRPGFTEEGLLTEAVEQFAESEDLQFLGAVINGADIPIEQREFDTGEERFLVEEFDNQEDPNRVGIS
jgi:capsular exopolysaccharide synthesis family protein